MSETDYKNENAAVITLYWKNGQDLNLSILGDEISPKKIRKILLEGIEKIVESESSLIAQSIFKQAQEQSAVNPEE